MKRVVVLGGGFGGAFVARRAAGMVRKDEADITLVARDNYLFFTPFCTEIVGGAMEVRHATSPLREMLAGRAKVVEAAVTRIDLAAKTVETTVGPVAYDLLVIALGSVTGTFNLPGVAQNAWFMRTLPEAIAYRNRVIDCLEEASRMPKGPDRTAHLTFAIAGAGPTGVELACDVSDFLDEIVRHQYPDIGRDEVKMMIVEGSERVLGSLDESLSAYAEKRMKRKKIELRLKTRIAAFDGAAISLNDGSSISCHTLAWTAGLAPNPVVAALDAPKDKGGRLELDENLRLKGHPDVFALGDCASFTQDGKTLGPEGQVAWQEAKVVAGNLIAGLRGRPLRKFRFRRLGRLVSLGRRYAVSEFFGMRFWGFPAWWLWRTTYLFKLPGLRNKLRVMLDWTLDLFFPRETVRIRYSGERKP
ncbi:MAG: NAD(P)/FAD-dependent oxidoreductase [Planctomycetota bacterium]